MTVVADASVLIALWRVQQIELLPVLFNEVLIPPAVASEISVANKAGGHLLEGLIWIQVVQLQNPAKVKDLTLAQSIYQRLHIGEAQSIVLAEELRADLLLMDERRGRAVARQHGLSVMGVGGVLLMAKNQGLLAKVRPVLDLLVAAMDFRLAKDLYLRLLELAGES